MNTLDVILVLAIFVILITLFRTRQFLNFKKEFGKWPAEISDKEIKTKLKKLGGELRKAESKYNAFLKQKHAEFNNGSTEDDYLCSQVQFRKLDLKRALKIARSCRRIPIRPKLVQEPLMARYS